MTDLTSFELRLAAVAAELYARMPAALVEECQALVALEPGDAGIRVHYDKANDRYDLTWVGRWLGSVAGSLVHGESSP